MTTTIQISEDNARQLAVVLQGSDRSPEELVNDVLRGYLHEDEAFRRSLQESIRELDAGLGLPHAQVMAEMEEIIRQYES